MYGQCDGVEWTGPKTCCSGSTCTYSNSHYSQCLPSGAPSSPPSSSSSTRGTSPTTSGNDARQSGVTTRYWDCCKASCAWAGKASVTNPVQTCARDGVTPVDVNAPSGCNGGNAYMCNNQQPWNVSSTLSYGYAAAHITVRENDGFLVGRSECVCMIRAKARETGAVLVTRWCSHRVLSWARS